MSENLEARPSKVRLHESVRRAVEWPLAILALLVIPALVLEERATDPTLRAMALAVNWIVWLAFLAEFVVGLALASRRATFLRASWFNLAIIAVSPPFIESGILQGIRSIRVLRLLRLLRAGGVLAIGLRSARRTFGRNKFHYVATFAISVVALGAVGAYIVEKEQNKAVGSLGDAFWWAIVTATTVGYGDVSPVTTEGRVIAVLLMLTGIGVIGVFTATVASYLLEEKTETSQSVEERLGALEAKVDTLLSLARTSPF